jgi:3-oxoacyl-[acyl-carrier-protein] synthase III
MLFQHVAIAGLAHIDAPRRLTSDEINARLKPTLDRLGIKTDVLGEIAGIHARYLWEDNVQASDVATLAGGQGAGRCRHRPGQGRPAGQHLGQPRLPGAVHRLHRQRQPGPADTCQNFDVANACLAFINGMDIASRMIERGEIDYALIVDGETANLAYEKTLERLGREDATEEQFRNELATLTLGSGAAAMVLARAELAPGAPRYKGGVTRAATEWNKLCRGNLDRHGHRHPHAADRRHQAGAEDLRRRQARAGLGVEELDQFVIHQVSKVHTAAFTKAIGIDPRRS